MEIIKYRNCYKEDYIRVHNLGFSGEDSVYDNKIFEYDEEENIINSFLATIEGEVVGLIDIVRVVDSKDTVEIDPVGVMPEYRNRGIGSALIEKCVEWCNKNNFKKIRALISNKAGKRLHRFYRKNDFKLAGQIFASKKGDIKKTNIEDNSPFPEEELRGHVYIYELEL